jgi:glutaredoxin
MMPHEGGERAPLTGTYVPDELQPAREEASMLVMYCRQWCGDCARARKWLFDNQIDYTEIDVDPSAKARAEEINHGSLHTPTFECETGTCVDFDPERVLELVRGV